MKLIFIAGREPSYARVSILLKGLKQNKVGVRECLCKSNITVVRYLIVMLKFLFTKKRDCDAVFVGFFGQPLVPFVRLFTRKKIIFDAFLSAYDTMVLDKRKIRKGSFLARLFYYLDVVSCKLADVVLVDTNEHIKYFASGLDVPRKKLKRILH